MYHERRSKPQAQAKKCPGKPQQPYRRRAVEESRVEGKQAAAKETRERKAEKKEEPLKISLPAMAKYHHHPEKRQKRSCRKNNQSQIQNPVHPDPRQSL